MELVHAATLLHDDVVDLGTMRRGQPSARTLYGNAASVFAGDWLLVAALREVRMAKMPQVLDALLEVIDEMIAAEALQLDGRGAVAVDHATYFRVIRGKTASLFRWGLLAGALGGGLDQTQAAAAARYGEQLGMAFQMVDDALDLSGDPAQTGKSLFRDLAEGKMTYPLIVGVEREPDLRPLLERAMTDDRLGTQVLAALERTGAVKATLAKAEAHALSAVSELGCTPEGTARDWLTAVAQAVVERRS